MTGQTKEEKAMEEQGKVKLSPEELVAMLDARIRSNARWKLRDGIVDGVGGSKAFSVSTDEKAMGALAAKVYDDVVSDFSYGNDNLVLATRALGPGKFTVAYCRRIIADAIDTKFFTPESVQAEAVLREAVSGMAGEIVEARGRRVKVK